MKEIIKDKIPYIILFLLFFIIYLIPIKETKLSESANFIQNPHSQANSDRLRISVETRENPLNPFYDGSNNISLITKLINTPLLSKDKNNNIILELAKEYWYEDNGKTIAVVLRDDLYFDNEEEIDAYNVKNTYKILAHKNYGGNKISFVEKLEGFYPYKMGIVEDFKGVEVLGRHFVKFHFNKSDFTNINSLTFPIIDIKDDDIENYDSQTLKEKKFINGSGNFRVDSFEKGLVSLSLKEDKISDSEDIELKKIDIYLLDYLDALNKYGNGSIDILYKYNKTKNFEKHFTKRTREYSYHIDNESNVYKFLGFNENSKLFSRADYRRALRDSIDFQDIVDGVYGKGVFNHRDIPVYRNSWFNNEKVDFEKSKKLSEILAKEYDSKDGFFRDQEEDIIIKLIVQSDNEFFKAIKDKFIEAIEMQGVKLDIKELDTSEMIEALRDGKDYDIFISQRHMDELPDTSDEELFNIRNRYTITSNLEDIFSYLLPKIKENVNDPEIQYMAKEWKLMFEESTPYIVLAVENKTSIINEKIEGIYLNEFIDLDNIDNLKSIHFRH